MAGLQTNVLCYGGSTGSATVNVTGGSGSYTYLWSPSGQATATASALTAGTYSVLVTDANGTTATQSFTITQPAALTATTAQTNILCNGNNSGSAGVEVSGGILPYAYEWMPSGGTEATATGLTAGTYAVTVTDGNGCTLVKTFTITQSSVLTATATQTNVSCNGDNNASAGVEISGGILPYTYEWMPSGGTESTATGLTAGTYTVSVTDGVGCQLVQEIIITEPAALTASALPTSISCNGANDGVLNIIPSGGTGIYTYSWTPAVSEQAQAFGLTPGNYSVTVTDANGCSVILNSNLTQPEVLIAPINKIDVLCNGGNNGYAATIPTGGTAPYTYEWSNGETTAAISNLLAGNYSVTITDLNGCTASSSVTIFEPEAIIITAQPQDSTVEVNAAANFIVEAENTNNYQWQVSEDGENWENVINGGENPIYSGVETNSLTINNVPVSYNGYMYRAQLGTNNCEVLVTEEAVLTVSDVSGTHDFKEMNMVIYPNPALGEMFISIPGFSAYNNLKVTIYDFNGRVIKEQGINAETSVLDIKDLESGVYVLTVISGTETASKRIVVKR